MQLGLETFRTRFGSDIVAEFRPAPYESRKVAILLAGCPGYPMGKRDLSLLLHRKGFLVIIPAYRGTWESGGSFLEFPPSDDVEMIISQLPEGFVDLWSGGTYSMKDPEVYLFGGSFGGAAALIASKHPSVKKAVSISGVVDWADQEHTVERLDVMAEYLPKAFGSAYRSSDPDAYMKLAKGDFYSPLREKASLDGSKLLFIHAKDDRIVHSAPAKALAAELGSRYVELKGDTHMGVGAAADPKLWKHIERHLKGK